MKASHRAAVLEKTSLGGAAAAFAVILTLAARDRDLDISLRVAMGSAIAALALFLAFYLSFDRMPVLDKDTTHDARGPLATAIAATAALGLLALAVAALSAHALGWMVGMAAFIWLVVMIMASLQGAGKEPATRTSATPTENNLSRRLPQRADTEPTS